RTSTRMNTRPFRQTASSDWWSPVAEGTCPGQREHCPGRSKVSGIPVSGFPMNAKTEQLEQWDRDHLWHPFTPMQAYAAEKPVIIERAHGCMLVDVEGREYIDGVSSLWCNVHGHRVPELDHAVREQLEQVAHSTLLGIANVPAIQLARRLVEMAPAGLTRVFFSDDGATAV